MKLGSNIKIKEKQYKEKIENHLSDNYERSFIIYFGLGRVKGFIDNIRINRFCNFLSNEIF